MMYNVISMYNWLTIKISKLVLKISKLRGGGSALPGLVLEKLNPSFAKKSLSELPHGVVVISGTNGKTSTTKMVVKILEDQGLRVFTNRTGSNFLRGVGSSLLQICDSNGKIDADIAVLELDEAHAVHFVQQIQPRYCLLLNVMRDQLDRFGELDKVADMLKKIAQSTTQTVVINREDSHLMKIASELGEKVCYYGYSDLIRQKFKTLDDDNSVSNAPLIVELIDQANNQTNTFMVGNQELRVAMKVSGIYNHFNAAGAIAIAKAILNDQLEIAKLKNSLENVQPAFGRGEKFTIADKSIELILVKNPSGFQMSLNSLAKPEAKTLIAINDNYADGRDVSWLWDVNFKALETDEIFATTGSRSKDMANRLKYDEIKVRESESNIEKAVTSLLNSDGDIKQIFSTYTAMLKIRQQLIRLSKKEHYDRSN